MNFNLLEGRIEKATSGSAAFDLFSTEDILVNDEPTLIPTGVKATFSSGLVAVIKEKSGLSIKGLEVKAGVIDSDYRDEWKVVVRYRKIFTKDKYHDHYQIKKGDKIAQVLLVELPQVELIGDGITIKSSERVGGFGSTGK